MNDYCIYLKVEPYLKHFLESSFGNPVRVDKDGPEARIIRKFITKTPAESSPDLGQDSNLSVVIPYFKEADPRVYNYMGKRAKETLIESFNHLLDLCLFRELGKLENMKRGQIRNQIYAWMEIHGISEESWDTISQKYYRMRKRYSKNNIKL